MTYLITEAKKAGLLPFANYNRLHVVPPCNISESEARDGLAILDEVIAGMDQFYTGA